MADLDALYPDASDITSLLGANIPDLHGRFMSQERCEAANEAFRALPPAIRAATVRDIFVQQYRNGGVDQFVWNHRDIAFHVAEAFEAIGAEKTATLIRVLGAELAESLLAEGEPLGTVQAFMQFRRSAGGPAFGPWLEFDPVEEVQHAILEWAQRHPEAFVID